MNQLVSLICDGEFLQPRSDDPNLSALQVNFYSNATAYTIRKNLKDGVFEKLDKTGAVKATFATFALALAGGKADALATKGLTVTDAACDHMTTRKAFCPTYNKTLEPAPPPTPAVR